MVVTMKKLQVLLPAVDRETFLSGLAKVGVVHIEEQGFAESTDDLDEIIALQRKYQLALNALNGVTDTSTDSGRNSATDAASLYEEYLDLDTKRTKLQQSISVFDKDIQLLSLWGNFDPALLKKLKEQQITITFHEVSAKQFSTLDLTDIPHEVIQSGNNVLFIVVHYREMLALECDTLTVPNKSLRELMEDREQCLEEIEECTKAIARLAPSRSLLADAIDTLKIQQQFEQARISMESGADGAVLLLNGWFPTRREKQVTTFLSSQTVWFNVLRPNVDEQPPVKLKNSKFVTLFEPITSMFSLPDYFELDPTPFFAPFFMFFYGMCLGDVGYGLVLLILSLVFLKKGPGTLKGIFLLITILSGMTIINGFLLNSFFGAGIFDLEGVEGIAGSGGVVPFLGPQVVNGKSEFPAITFAVYLGFVQMLLGMLLQVYNTYKNKGLLYAIQPICYIPLSLAVFIFLCKADFLSMGSYQINSIQLGTAIAAIPGSVMTALLCIGLVPFIFLNSPQIKFYLRPLMALYALYNFASDIVSSGLSYLRLFALGLAGGLLGNAFNEIALMLIRNDQGDLIWGSPLIVFTILIMVAGHALNFFLSALGAYVHSVRLIFVEFYKFLNFNGGGKAYVPFAEHVTKNN